MNSTLENRHFVATDNDIERMARDHTASLNGTAAVMQKFLQVLVGTTIAELKAEPRTRSRSERKLADKTLTKVHLDAFEAVYGRIYAVLVRALAAAPANPESLPRILVGRKPTRKALVQAQATKFRSSAVTLRAWIRAGFDITALAPGQVTRSELDREVKAAKGPRRRAAAPSGLDRVARRADGAAKRFMAFVNEVARFDGDRAAEIIAKAAAELAATRAKLSGMELSSTTTSLKKAAAGMPLDIGAETFVLLPYKSSEPRAAAH